MNTGQMMTTAGALVLLSLVILRVNNNFLNTNSVLLDSKLGVIASSIATSIIEEATGKAFDESTVSGTVESLTSLSTNLQKETGEVYPDFDDFDDYNNFYKFENTVPAADFHVNCEVVYVNDTDLDGSTSSRTWNKKITVRVSSPSMLGQDDIPDTLEMSAVYSYWYFR